MPTITLWLWEEDEVVGMGPPELVVPTPLLLLGGCSPGSSAFHP